jgi:hypothetical protein
MTRLIPLLLIAGCLAQPAVQPRPTQFEGQFGVESYLFVQHLVQDKILVDPFKAKDDRMQEYWNVVLNESRFQIGH